MLSSSVEGFDRCGGVQKLWVPLKGFIGRYIGDIEGYIGFGV